MNEAELLREQAWWEAKEEIAQRAVNYASNQIERISKRLVELTVTPQRHLSLVQYHAQVILLHGGETE